MSGADDSALVAELAHDAVLAALHAYERSEKPAPFNQMKEAIQAYFTSLRDDARQPAEAPEQSSARDVTQADEIAFHEAVEVLPTGAIRNLGKGLSVVLARHATERSSETARLRLVLEAIRDNCPQCDGDGRYPFGKSKVMVPCEFCELARAALEPPTSTEGKGA